MEGDDTDPTLAAVAPITNSPPHGQPRAKSHKTAYLSSALYKVRRSALRTMDAEALIYWGLSSPTLSHVMWQHSP